MVGCPHRPPSARPALDRSEQATCDILRHGSFTAIPIATVRCAPTIMQSTLSRTGCMLLHNDIGGEREIHIFRDNGIADFNALQSRRHDPKVCSTLLMCWH